MKKWLIGSPVTKEMHLCVDFASKVGGLMADKLNKIIDEAEGGAAVLTMDLDIDPFIKEIFPHIPMSDNRKKWLAQEIMDQAIAAVMDGGLASCHIWKLAHNFHHIFYDSDMPHHPS